MAEFDASGKNKWLSLATTRVYKAKNKSEAIDLCNGVIRPYDDCLFSEFGLDSGGNHENHLPSNMDTQKQLSLPF